MQNEFAFFPGCVLTQAAKEAKMSLEAIASVCRRCASIVGTADYC